MQSSFENIIPLQNADIFVKQFGAKGPDLIFIHGGPGWDHSYLLPFVLPLALNFRLTFFDLRDCGQSSTKNSDHKIHSTYIDACAEDLGELLQKLEICDVNILGFSFGGRVAMRFAEINPNKINRLILASTTYSSNYKEFLKDKSEYKALMSSSSSERINQLWNKPGDQYGSITRELAFDTLKFNIHNPLYVDIANKTLDNIRFTDLWGMGYSPEKTQLMSKKDYSSSLIQLKSKLLILHGDKDLVFPIEMAESLHKLIPGSTFNILWNTGHLAHIEANEAWIKSIKTFLLNPFTISK